MYRGRLGENEKIGRRIESRILRGPMKRHDLREKGSKYKRKNRIREKNYLVYVVIEELFPVNHSFFKTLKCIYTNNTGVRTKRSRIVRFIFN